MFAVPDGDSTRAARFHWTGPTGMGFASDLEHSNGLTTLDGITESVVIGGRDLHVATSGPADARVRVARLGNYAFDTGAFDALVLKVIEAERGFWREQRPGPFLVTMARSSDKEEGVSVTAAPDAVTPLRSGSTRAHPPTR